MSNSFGESRWCLRSVAATVAVCISLSLTIGALYAVMTQLCRLS